MKTTPCHGARAALRRASMLATAFAILLVAQGASAAPAISIANARIRLLPGNLPLAGYFDAANRGNRPVALTGASSPAFKMIHLHRSTERNGISTMVMVRVVDIKPGAAVHFAPGGYHLMLMNRTRSLRAGDKVPIRLTFADGESLEVSFTVNGAETQ
jgi:copper(I)-binding protein